MWSLWSGREPNSKWAWWTHLHKPMPITIKDRYYYPTWEILTCEPGQQSQPLQLVEEMDWNPQSRTRVCSDHSQRQDSCIRHKHRDTALQHQEGTSMEDLMCIAAAAAKSLQLCPTLRDPIDGSPPGSSIPGILQARTLEWVAISFSNAWKWKVKVKSLSHVWLPEIPWTTAHQVPPPMGFSRQEYWSGVPLPSL